ncbi:MAG: CHASE3 domain-containing protein, partial [Elusimicrobiota bacterium]
MSIKTRITFILVLFIVVVIGLGLSSIYVSRLQSEYFTVSAAYVELRENMSEAKRLFDDQAQSFDYFIFLSQNSEKHNYRAKKTELLRKLDQIADSGLYDQYIDECRDKVWRLNELFDRAINLAEGGDNSSAVRLAEQRIIGKANELKEIFDLRIADLNKKVEESRNTAVSFKQRMTDYLTFSFSFIILIMFIMSW